MYSDGFQNFIATYLWAHQGDIHGKIFIRVGFCLTKSHAQITQPTVMLRQQTVHKVYPGLSQCLHNRILKMKQK